MPSTIPQPPRPGEAAAVALARAILAELRQVTLSSDPAAPAEVTPGYWVGRLETALGHLADAFEAAAEIRTVCSDFGAR